MHHRALGDIELSAIQRDDVITACCAVLSTVVTELSIGTGDENAHGHILAAPRHSATPPL